jgi:hypothetical protein
MTTDWTGPAPSARRAAELLFLLSTLGEMGVGIAVLAFPEILALLLDMRLDAAGLLAARMLGSAVLAIGITWWVARRDPQRISRYAAGFIVYNLGFGVLFVFTAAHASRPALPCLVAVVHLLAGAGMVAAVLLRVGETSAD